MPNPLLESLWLNATTHDCATPVLEYPEAGNHPHVKASQAGIELGAAELRLTVH